jgi:hypothetical protein
MKTMEAAHAIITDWHSNYENLNLPLSIRDACFGLWPYLVTRKLHNQIITIICRFAETYIPGIGISCYLADTPSLTGCSQDFFPSRYESLSTDVQPIFVYLASEVMMACDRISLSQIELIQNTVRGVMHVIRTSLTGANRFYPGPDFRQNLHHGAAMLNQIWLYRALSECAFHEEAVELRANIIARFWKGEYFVGYEEETKIDVVANTFAVVHGLVPRDHLESVAKLISDNARPERIPLPYTLQTEDNISYFRNGEAYLEWPMAYMAIAVKEGGLHSDAHEIMRSLGERTGFPAWSGASGVCRGGQSILSACTFAIGAEFVGSAAMKC